MKKNNCNTECKIGSIVRLLRGSAEGHYGKVLDMSKKYDQIDVQLKDNSVRYIGYDDIEVIW